jgi:hypothetical protein
MEMIAQDEIGLLAVFKAAKFVNQSEKSQGTVNFFWALRQENLEACCSS